MIIAPPGELIAVWFSCGAASAVAAKLTVEIYGKTNPIRVINNPVIEEHPDNRRFLISVQKWLGMDIENAQNPKYPNASAVEVWENRKFMSSPRGAPCTLELKKNARYLWEKENQPKWHVLGFTADERERHARFIKSERSNVLPVLINAGYTKQRCFDVLRAYHIQLPKIYEYGFSNVNCIGCVKSKGVGYWQNVRKNFPEIFSARAQQSRRIGCKLVVYKGERIFLDELPINAIGRQQRKSVECGIFCEPEKL